MSDSSPPRRLRDEIESQLAEDLREKQLAWRRASAGDRDLARQQFINALHVFNTLVLHGKFSERTNEPGSSERRKEEPASPAAYDSRRRDDGQS